MGTKSDVPAKQAFIRELINEGFETAEIKAKPSDIVATKNGETWYYEIKLTDLTDTYFGAATLTEWEQAFNTPDRYRFVVAIRHTDGTFEFREFTPQEFMQYSTIPPFKVYFNIRLDDKKAHGTTRTAVPLTEDNFQQMNELFNKMRNSR